MAAKFACHALFFYAVTRFVLDGSEIADRLYASERGSVIPNAGVPNNVTQALGNRTELSLVIHFPRR
jgi:hypothetical protein